MRRIANDSFDLYPSVCARKRERENERVAQRTEGARARMLHMLEIDGAETGAGSEYA